MEEEEALRLSADEVSAAKHVPIARVVSTVVQLNKRGFALCPFHEERTPSFHIIPKLNIFKCLGASCGAVGDTINFVQRTRGVDFCSAVQMLLGGDVGRRPKLVERKVEPQGNAIEYVHRLWHDADAPEVAEFYLDSRGIRVRPRPLPLAVRGSRRVWCSETRQYRPALLAAVSVDSGIVAVQRIWTETSYCAYEAKGAKAKLAAPKKTIGRMGHGAVQLSPPQDILGIAEGVETAMSAATLFRMPVWAALGAQRMGCIALPEIVRSVIVFGDRGDAGERAAHAAVSAYRRRGYVSDAVLPEPQFGDFNDQLCRR